jgi:LmbE family N-acetylglucosaminyl deacetylase
MSAGDFIEAISATYGTATKPGASVKATQSYRDSEELLAEWQDPQYRFELVRYSYGPTFKLVGISKKLEAPAQATGLEAKRLDDQEAPRAMRPDWRAKQEQQEPGWTMRGL